MYTYPNPNPFYLTIITHENLKPHLQKHIPGAHVEIINRHKKGIIEATCTINDSTYNITLHDAPGGYTCRIKTLTPGTETEEETHTNNHNTIINALKQPLTK